MQEKLLSTINLWQFDRFYIKFRKLTLFETTIHPRCFLQIDTAKVTISCD